MSQPRMPVSLPAYEAELTAHQQTALSHDARNFAGSFEATHQERLDDKGIKGRNGRRFDRSRESAEESDERNDRRLDGTIVRP